jgi:N6-adenosine-specific RNA methylase IME4
MNQNSDLVIVQLDRARIALAEAKTIQDTKQIADIAAAAEIYARRQKLSQESIDYAHDIKIEALAQLGRMLKETPRNVGAVGSLVTGSKREPLKDDTPTLADLGLDKKTSSLAQKLAALPAEQFEQVKAGAASITQAIREVTHAQRPPSPSPKGKYRVFYADPPWHYGNSGLQQYGHASHHFPPMSIAELCALPVKAMTQEDAVLFLWVTSPLLEECFEVINAWGFAYKTSFVWDKVKHNFGHYNSVRHELLLVCTRGSCTPDVPTLIDSVQTIERTAKHSEKPEEFRKIIDTLYPNGKRIELFARARAEGWDAWGNEAIA